MHLLFTESPTEGTLIIIGGTKQTRQITSEVNTYLIKNGAIASKHTGEPAPYGWGHGGTATRGSEVYIVGGDEDQDGPENRAALYSVTQDKWTELPSMSFKRHYRPSVFIFGHYLYATGERLRLFLHVSN